MIDVTTEFIHACLTGDLDTLNNLLRRKEEIDVKQLDKCPLLKIAVRKGHLDIVRRLVRVGVNVNQTRPNSCSLGPLHLACRLGNLPIAELLVENGADIDAIDVVLKWTPLNIAVLMKKTSITKLLLKNGCKTNVRNHEGLTGLEIALKKGFVGIAKLIAFHNK